MRLPSAIARIDRLMRSCAECGATCIADAIAGRAGSRTCRLNVPIEPMIAEAAISRRDASRFRKRASCSAVPRPATAARLQLLEWRRPAPPAHDAGLLPDPRRPGPRERPVRDGRARAFFVAHDPAEA